MSAKVLTTAPPEKDTTQSRADANGRGSYTLEQIAKLRHVFDMEDEKEIKKAILTYTKIVALIHSYCPDCGPERAEWALAMAMEWFGEALKNRLQNSMLVSTLLLTTTAAYFVEPPDSLYPKTSASFRVFIWICGICNMCFTLSIVSGIYYIQNAMSRPYGQSERFYLVMKFYNIKNISQVLAGIGNILFPIVLALPMQHTFLDIDSYALWGITGFYVVFGIVTMITTTNAAKKEQTRRLARLSEIIDKDSSYVNPQYYPSDAPMKVDDYLAMFHRSAEELK